MVTLPVLQIAVLVAGTIAVICSVERLFRSMAMVALKTTWLLIADTYRL